MKKRYFDASTMHLVNKETGVVIQTKEDEVVEIKSAKNSNHSKYKSHDFKGDNFFTLNTDIFQQYLIRAELKSTEKGFLLQLLMHNCARNYCILLDSAGVPLTTKSIALEFDLNESTVSAYLKKLFKSKIIIKKKDIRPGLKSLQVLYVNPYFYKNSAYIHAEVKNYFQHNEIINKLIKR